jgi:two-component system response regulator HydG
MRERPRIVVVDDHFVLAETLADGLADHGYDAVAVAHGRDALALVDADCVDLVVTDLRMPDIDGLSLLASVRAAAADLPVIIMTAHGAVDTAIEAIRRGASHYLLKPFKLDELLMFVAHALAPRQA